jgi:hypothetical protein
MLLSNLPNYRLTTCIGRMYPSKVIMLINFSTISQLGVVLRFTGLEFSANLLWMSVDVI